MTAIVLALALIGVSNGNQRDAVLTWNPSNQVVNYRVHRSTNINGPFPIIASGIQVTHWEDKTVQAGQTYYYVVDCRNPATNLISKYSNEVKAVIP